MLKCHPYTEYNSSMVANELETTNLKLRDSNSEHYTQAGMK